MDDVPIKMVRVWEEQFLTYMREQRSEVRAAIIKERKLSKELEAKLVSAIEAFKPQFKG
jgi:F-type H+-transporting ATPase subunit alpha